jgi:hypothetical protein
LKKSWSDNFRKPTLFRFRAVDSVTYSLGGLVSMKAIVTLLVISFAILACGGDESGLQNNPPVIDHVIRLNQSNPAPLWNYRSLRMMQMATC